MIIRAKRLLPKIILLLFALLVVFSLLLFKKSGLLTVQKVEIRTGFQFQSPKKIENILKPYWRRSFFFIDFEKLAQEIKNSELKIDQVKISKEFSGKLILEIKGRQPLAAIFKDNFYFLVDEEGVVFSLESSSKNLPLLEIDLQNLKIGSRIEIEGIKIPQILAALGQIKVDKISLKNERVELETDEGCLIILPKVISDGKIEALQMIVNRFKIEGKRLTKIDLRFAKPVISF